MRRSILTSLILAAMALPSYGSMFDDLDELKGETVVEAGDLKKLSCPISGEYNCLTWPTALFRLNTYCVEAVGAYASVYPLRGILTTSDSGVALFIIGGSIGSTDVKRYPAKVYECPAGLY